MKLLAKMAEDRYQTARGLQRDLVACLDRWRESGRIDPFPLGERDVPDRLQIPQILYGRDQAGPGDRRAACSLRARRRHGSPRVRARLRLLRHREVVACARAGEADRRSEGAVHRGQVRPAQARRSLLHDCAGLPGAGARPPRGGRRSARRLAAAAPGRPRDERTAHRRRDSPGRAPRRPPAARPRAAAGRGAEPVPLRVPALRRRIHREGSSPHALHRRSTVGRSGQPRAAPGPGDPSRDALSPRGRRLPQQRGDVRSSTHVGGGLGAQGRRARLRRRGRSALERAPHRARRRCASLQSPRSRAARGPGPREDRGQPLLRRPVPRGALPGRAHRVRPGRSALVLGHGEDQGPRVHRQRRRADGGQAASP